MDELLRDVRACTFCSKDLPLGPRPVVRALPDSRILIVGQAPGTRVHASGIPWDDPSGVRLRRWLDVSEPTFYSARNFGIVPMGFCYPGRGNSGDLPPRPECAPLWHPRLFAAMPKVELTLLIGQFAQRYYLKEHLKPSLSETVRLQPYEAPFMALPHPSPRNIRWFKMHPWFEEETVPVLRKRVHDILQDVL